MALSTLVPATVSSISLLAKSSIAGLQIWSLHGLLLTVEAAGLSYVSHVQVAFFVVILVLLEIKLYWCHLVSVAEALLYLSIVRTITSFIPVNTQ